MERITKINISDLVDKFDPVAAGQRLLDAVRAQMKEARISYPQVAEMIGMPASRLDYLLNEPRESMPRYTEGFTSLTKHATKVLYREEVTNLALITATPLDKVFEFPEIDESRMSYDERYDLKEQLPQMCLTFILGCLAKYDRISDVFK